MHPKFVMERPVHLIAVALEFRVLEVEEVRRVDWSQLARRWLALRDFDETSCGKLTKRVPCRKEVYICRI